MRDLTQGSVTRHLLHLSAFLAVSMFFQTLYFLADLYWVGRLGKEAVAAVSLAGNLTLVILALTQTLGVGTTALISHAVGQRDQKRAQLVFNQAFVLSQVVGVVFGVIALATRDAYCRWLGADGRTAQLGQEYLLWFIPALWLQFALVSMGSALRGTGNVKPTVAIQILTVLLNIVLAPFLIFGWVTGRALGVAGAALASLIAILVGSVALVLYFVRRGSYLRFAPAEWKPQGRVWSEMSRIGLPAGAEFGLLSLYLVLVYWIIRGFGAAAQAGFGIGGRLLQAMFLPGIAIAFAVAPVAGQNYGARNADRVRQTFYAAATLTGAVMLVLTLLCHLVPEGLIRAFSRDANVLSFGREYLTIISWNFLAQGLIFTSSSMFQGMGNTLPSMASSSSRLFLFALPAYLLSLQPGFQIRHVWYLSVATVTLQALLNLYLLRREFSRRLMFAPAEKERLPLAITQPDELSGSSLSE